MTCFNNNDFVGVSGIGQNYLMNQLEDNLKSYLDNGFLKIGGFVNIDIPHSGITQMGQHQLYPTELPGYDNFQVWQSFKKDWVWETGISYQNFQPNQFSGVYVNNMFYPGPTGSGIYSYHVNYQLGRIIFDQPLTSGTNMQTSYSYKWCQVYKSSTCSWWKQLQESTLENNQISKTNIGDFSIGAEHRVQMPCIIIEPISRSDMIPYQLGAINFRVRQDFLLHIFTENNTHKNDILDILRLQNNKLLYLYDTNKTKEVYGLDYKGVPKNNQLSYDNIINDNNYRWKSCYLYDMNILDIQNVNFDFGWCTLRVTSEIIL